MTSWSAVTRDDLLSWANSDGAPSALPELIRRLVLETGDGVQAVDFPGGSGVTTGGFDGFVRTANATAFIPIGASVWELSVRKGAAAKADEDYVKRNQVPDGSPTFQATYLQLICRPWIKADEWARDRSIEGRWREVRGYNVDHLTTWLEHAPATRQWLLERMGRPTVGIYSGTEWWERWASATEPKLTPEVVLAQRAGIDNLKTALHRSGITTVAGPIGVDEIVACALATVFGDNGDALARTIVVEDRSAWTRLLKAPNPLVLVATDPSFARDVDRQTKHTVVIPVPQHDDGDVVLDAADSDAVVEAIRKLDGSSPYDLGALARRSFVAFRRRLAKRPELMTPRWVGGQTPRVVRAALLLTGWHDRSDADRRILEALAGVPYEIAREELLPYTQGDDPLIALTADRWHVVSPVDAWLMLGRHLLADDLQVFMEQASIVLSERDPGFDLPREERWRANIDGKVLTHSTSLRNGIASGLALLGTYGDTVVAATGLHGEQWTSRVLRPLLQGANADRSGERWASIAELLPLFIEAAPQDVLEAVREGTSGEDPVLASIFQDDPNDDSLFGPGSPHTSFLWALETVAWSVEYLGQASQLLAVLASLDPGGRLFNRPAASLENIFCAWHPDTAADRAQRLVVIDRLRKRWPDIAWDLMISLLPSSHGIHHPTSEPKFRDWKPPKLVVLVSDYWQLIEGVLGRLLDDVGTDAHRWVTLLEAHEQLPVELRPRVRAEFATLRGDQFTDEARRTLWEAIRKSVAHHREYADARWALPADELAALESAGANIAPTEPAHWHRWLFADDWIDLGDLRRRDDRVVYEQEVAARRAKAIREIVGSGSIDDVLTFAAQVRTGVVGVALADSFEDTFVEEMLDWLQAEETQRTVALNYLWRRCRVGGLPWAMRTLKTHPDLDAGSQAQLLVDIDDFRGGREEAQRRGPDVEREYWLRFVHFGRGGDFPDVLLVAKHLARVGRFAAALDTLALYAPKERSDTAYAEAVATAFEGFIEAGGVDPENHLLRSWDFERLLAALDEHVDEIGIDRVTRIQWYFFPVLGYDPPTTTLHRRLAESPDFFVEILSIVYRRKDDEGADPSQSYDQGVWQNAHRLLDSWSVPPRQDAEGRFDLKRCHAWIDEALPLLEQADRLEIGKQQIGEVLTYAPSGEDSWPNEEVADLIETLDDDDIDQGVALEIRNRRGTTRRGITEGGRQERDLATDYRSRAQRFRDTHPRVAHILNRLADGYEDEARRNDAEAERRRRGLDW